MTQAIWSTSHGRFLETTEVAGTQITRLGVHVDPMLAVLAPLWRLWPSPLMLVTVQALAVASGAVPVYWLARKHLSSESVAALLALTYLAYPSLQWAALNEFEPLALAVPLVLAAIWYLDEDRLGPFVLVAVPAAACGEMMPIVIGGLGLWYALRTRRWLRGLGIFAAGAAWTAIALLVIIPHFSHGPSPFYGRYADVGGSPAGIARTMVTHPLRIVDAVVTYQDLAFVLALTLPLLGLFLLAPTLLLAAVPELAMSLLSQRGSDLWIGANVVTPDIPILIAASIFGIARLGRHAERASKIVLPTAIFCTVLIGPGSLAAKLLSGPPPDSSAARHLRTENEALSLIPPTASVSATNHLGSHLSTRRFVYSFPVLRRADWIVVDAKDPWLPLAPDLKRRAGYAVPVRDMISDKRRLQSLLSGLRKNPRWVLVYSRDEVVVFRRSASRAKA
jgi:uncharacterized membrane protein